MTVERVSGGQSNPTFFVTYENRRLVLRKRPDGNVLPSAHAIDREYRAMAAIAASDVPVPKVLHYQADAGVIGTPFYVMERIEGRVFADPALPGVDASDRRRVYFAMADTLARLHAIDWKAAGLEDFGRADDYFARQVARWSRQWELSRTRDSKDVDQLVGWLRENIPAGQVAAISHGDFRIGNLMFHPFEPRVVGVLDWELSTIGHPLADVAFSALAWRLMPSEYMGMRGVGAAGLPSEKDYLDRYRAAAPETEMPQAFHFTFALFRLAVIFEGIAARAKSGDAASADAAEVGALSSVFVARAFEAIDS